MRSLFVTLICLAAACNASSSSANGPGNAAGSTSTTADGIAEASGAGARSSATANASGLAAGSGGTSDAAGSQCAPQVSTDIGRPDVQGSGLTGSISTLTPQQKQAFCDWLWAIPGYGQAYCCHGVARPQVASVSPEETKATCVQMLNSFDSCPNVRIEYFESCALDRAGRYCSTPPGCFAFGHGALTSTCLRSDEDAGVPAN